MNKNTNDNIEKGFPIQLELVAKEFRPAYLKDWSIEPSWVKDILPLFPDIEEVDRFYVRKDNTEVKNL